MAATSTQEQIVSEVVERYGLGRRVTLSSQTTTTLVLTTEGSPELRGPFTGLKFPVGSPVIIISETSGTDVLGDRTFVSNWVPSTGTITVSPAIGGTDGTAAIIFDPSVADPDRLLEAINRALTNRMGRWQMRELTFAPDGDLQGTTVTDYWTAAANGTGAYATAQIYPAGSAADAFGQTGVSRLLQLTTDGVGSSTLTGNGIRWPLSTSQRTWYFRTAIRLVSGTGTAELRMRDNTNGADITLQVTRGNDSNTLTTTTLGDFMVCEGTFQMPATCAEIAPRLVLSAATMVMQMAPIHLFPSGVYSFPLPNRIETDEVLGNFYTALSTRGPSGISDMAFSEPLSGGLEHRLHDYGDHRTVTFNFPVCRPLWYEEFQNYDTLTALTSTTTAPLDAVAKWTMFELADQEMWTRLRQNNTSADSELVTRNKKQVRNALLKAAQNSAYEPQVKTIVGRRN